MCSPAITNAPRPALFCPSKTRLFGSIATRRRHGETRYSAFQNLGFMFRNLARFCKIWLPCKIWNLVFFILSISGLRARCQISEEGLRNLSRNLEIFNEISGLCQISDFRKTPPKVGDLPAVGGGGHHLPLGNLLGPKFRPASNPTTAAGTAKHQPPSSSTPSSQPEEETTHADTTLSGINAGATPENATARARPDNPCPRPRHDHRLGRCAASAA